MSTLLFLVVVLAIYLVTSFLSYLISFYCSLVWSDNEEKFKENCQNAAALSFVPICGPAIVLGVTIYTLGKELLTKHLAHNKLTIYLWNRKQNKNANLP